MLVKSRTNPSYWPDCHAGWQRYVQTFKWAVEQKHKGSPLFPSTLTPLLCSSKHRLSVFQMRCDFLIWENKFSIWVNTFACLRVWHLPRLSCHGYISVTHNILSEYFLPARTILLWGIKCRCVKTVSYFPIYSRHRAMEPFPHTHKHTLKQMLPHHQTTYSHSHSHTGVILSVHSSWAACLWTVGGRVKRPEESHADTQGTRNPHTEGTSCLGTELFISWGCDHFWAWCGINHMNLCVNASRAPDNAHSAWRRVKEVNCRWRTIRQLKKRSIEKCLEKSEGCSQVFLRCI